MAINIEIEYPPGRTVWFAPGDPDTVFEAKIDIVNVMRPLPPKDGVLTPLRINYTLSYAKNPKKPLERTIDSSDGRNLWGTEVAFYQDRISKLIAEKKKLSAEAYQKGKQIDDHIEAREKI